MTTTTTAIERSITHNEIVDIDYDGDEYLELLAQCDEHEDSYAYHEFWGTRDGEDWRVHMRRREYSVEYMCGRDLLEYINHLDALIIDLMNGGTREP